MVKMIDLHCFQKLSYYSEFGTQTLKVSELMESIFGTFTINPVNIEPSIVNENWPRFNITSMLILL